MRVSHQRLLLAGRSRRQRTREVDLKGPISSALRALRALCALCALCVLLPSAPASATLLRPLSLSDLSASSEWVARVRVRAVSARWEGGRIISEALLEPLELLRAPKGVTPPPAFTLRVLGGVVGDLAQRVLGSPVPAAGEEAVVFLTCRPDGLLVREKSSPEAPDCALVGLTQGYWRAEEGAEEGSARWAPALGGVEWLGGRPPALGGVLEGLRAP